MAITTTKSIFGNVQDCTFKGARMQSAIREEIAKEEGVDTRFIPHSTTPEQLIKFYRGKCESASTPEEEIKVYKATIKLIEDREALRKEIRAYRDAEERKKDEYNMEVEEDK